MEDLQTIGETTAPLTTRKNEKVLNIGPRIDSHDLNARIKQIVKWLNKHQEVRVMINGVGEEDMERCEKIFKAIESSLSEVNDTPKIVQKKQRNSLIKFNILPSVLVGSKQNID